MEPDFFRVHIRSGLGFKGRNLCKAELDAKKCADSLSFEEACDSAYEVESEVHDKRLFLLYF